jgi:DnaJ-class molecular chaperone
VFEAIGLAQDLYQELGVPRSASADEVRKAFRKLAKELHPDKNPGDKKSEERFKRISAAFDILGDEDKRKKYDRGQIDANGHETMGGGYDPFSRGGGFSGARGPRRGGPADQAEGMQFEGVDLNDILGDMFGGGKGQGANRRTGAFSAKGADVRATLQVDIEDAVRGGKKRISFSDGRSVDVNIPKGAHEGQVLRLKGQGSPGRGGPGDAMIELQFAPHPIYRREADQLVMDLPVSLPDAVLGAKVEAPTPDGTVSLTVPKGSNSGATLRLKARGLPDARTGTRGDLLARIMISLPEPPDPALEALAETIRRDRPYTPRRRG